MKPEPPKSIESVLAEHPFTRGLKLEHIRALTDNALRMHYEPGQIIFCEGDPANRFYLIEQGKVSLEARRGERAPLTIQMIGPGDVLGWSWLFPPYYWHFDARAVEPTEAIFFYGTRLREQCQDDYEFGYELLKRMTAVIIQRLQASRDRLWTVSRTVLAPVASQNGTAAQAKASNCQFSRSPAASNK